MPVIPAGWAQLTLFFSGDPVPTGAAVTLGLDAPGGGTPTGALDAIEDLFEPLHEAISISTCFLSTARVKLGPDDTGPFAERSYIIAGNQGTDGQSPGVAVLVTKQTAVGGRHGRGRLYYPCPTDASILTSGSLDGAYVTQMQDAFDTFYDGLVAASWPPALLHEDSAIGPNAITAFVVEPRVATQRRRNRR